MAQSKREKESGTKLHFFFSPSPTTYTAKVFLDCTYDGDLVRFAGASYTWGRESQEQFNESYAGVRPYETFANFIEKFPVLATLAPNSTELLPYIDPTPLAPVGSADQRIMSFTYRYLALPFLLLSSIRETNSCAVCVSPKRQVSKHLFLNPRTTIALTSNCCNVT